MHTTRLDDWQHEHTFGQDAVTRAERRTLYVAALTAVFMVVEIAAGLAFGSMALLADGLHMGSHAVALGIAVAAYVYARRRASDQRFSFGTGKVNALGGFTGALLLAVFAVLMVWESVERILQPVDIVFDQAIAVAVLGLLVNGVSVLVLGVHSHGHGDHGHGHGDHGHGHGDHGHPHGDHGHGHGDHGHGHGDHGHEHHGHEHHEHEHHEHGEHEHHEHGHHEHERHEHGHHEHGRHERGHHGHQDHNLRSAYLHVLADALTSVTAIVALVAGKYYGQVWLDPAMGVVGSLLVARWSWGLLRESSHVLLDHQAPPQVRARIQSVLEADSEDRVADLHVWSIGPGVRAACIVLVSHTPRPPEHYKRLLPADLLLHHVTVEVHRCPDAPAGVGAPDAAPTSALQP